METSPMRKGFTDSLVEPMCPTYYRHASQICSKHICQESKARSFRTNTAHCSETMWGVHHRSTTHDD